MRSGFEAFIYNDLVKRGVIFEYEPWQIEYFLPRKGACGTCGDTNIFVSRWYLPDFVFGDTRIVEAKGYLDSASRTKMIAVKEAWPNLDIRFLFQRDNYITKKKLQTYSQWAEKHGFPYAIGHRIPEEWVT